MPAVATARRPAPPAGPRAAVTTPRTRTGRDCGGTTRPCLFRPACAGWAPPDPPVGASVQVTGAAWLSPIDRLLPYRAGNDRGLATPGDDKSIETDDGGLRCQPRSALPPSGPAGNQTPERASPLHFVTPGGPMSVPADGGPPVPDTPRAGRSR